MNQTLHPLYATWMNMIRRCHAPKAQQYDDYGGRGITVCDRWRERKTGFHNWLADMGPKPTPQHTMDRKDNDRGYSPDNCRWATRREQLLNRSIAVMITDPNGVLHTAIAVSERYGLSRALVAIRHHQGKSWDEIISTHHLEPGYDHVQEAIAKSARLNRERTHCKQGHELTPENTLRNAKNPNYRGCRECQRLGSRRHYHKLKAAAQR